MWPFWRASTPPHSAGFAHVPVRCEARGSCWSIRGLHPVMVNLGTQFRKVIIKVVRRMRAGRAQGKHSPTTTQNQLQYSHLADGYWVCMALR